MIPAQVQAVLEAHGLGALEFESGSTPTAQTAADRIGVAVGQIAKSLLFKDKAGGFHLVLCAGDAKVHSGELKRLVGSNVSMTSPEETFEITGFYPGGVCPFGVTKARIWLDASLRRFEVVYPAAGNNASGVPVTVDKLKEITGAVDCAVGRLSEVAV